MVVNVAVMVASAVTAERVVMKSAICAPWVLARWAWTV